MIGRENRVSRSMISAALVMLALVLGPLQTTSSATHTLPILLCNEMGTDCVAVDAKRVFDASHAKWVCRSEGSHIGYWVDPLKPMVGTWGGYAPVSYDALDGTVRRGEPTANGEVLRLIATLPMDNGAVSRQIFSLNKEAGGRLLLDVVADPAGSAPWHDYSDPPYYCSDDRSTW